jgi:hypothetical protein
MAEFVDIRPDGILIRILVQPRASKNEVVGLQAGELKIRLTSPPVEGAANDLCRQFLSKKLRIPRRDISIVAGEKSRHKRILVKTGQPAALRQVLQDRLAVP